MEKISVLLALCEGNPLVTRGFPPRSPLTLSFDVFSDLRLNKRLSKQPIRRWLETPSRSLWRYCNDKTSLLMFKNSCLVFMRYILYPYFKFLAPDTYGCVFNYRIFKTKHARSGGSVDHILYRHMASLGKTELKSRRGLCRLRYHCNMHLQIIW